MNVLDAVEAALQQLGTPQNYREITVEVLKQGLWQAAGKTPDATVNARLAVDIKDNGSKSRFQRTDKGVFALRGWGLPEHLLDKQTTPAITKPSSNSSSISVTTPTAPVVIVASPPIVPSPNGTVTFTDATEKVLDQYGNKKPMYYKDIAAKALSLGLLNTVGQTPEATLYAQVLTEIGRATKRGKTPRFVKHGKGMVGLTKWLPSGLIMQIDQHNKTIRQQLHFTLLQMIPVDFEQLIGKLLTKFGFEQVDVTKASGDGGIDVRGTLVVGDVIRTNMAVQVKRWKNNIQSPTVQQLRGSLTTHEQGLIITTSDFSQGARQEAKKVGAVPIALMSGEQLVELLIEHGIGAHRGTAYLLELGDEDDDD